MRRNVTLSFDDEFLVRVDRARGVVPRSRFLEGLLVGGGSVKGVEREALLMEGLGSPGEGLLEGEPVARPRGHLSTCRCGVCRPVKS